VARKKKLTLHVNRKIAASEAHSLLMPVEPIVSVTDAPSGLHELRVRDSQGNRIGFFQIAAIAVDEQLLEDLHDWRARHAGVVTSLNLS
jgi:hypothetical protein